jgi:nucleotide-binding universal stress UspA family protein
MLNKILAPLDGSEVSKCTLDYVKAAAAGRQEAEVVLMTVIEPITPIWVEYMSESQAKSAGAEAENTKKLMNQKAEEYLAKAKEILSKAGIAVKTTVIESKWSQGVADAILDYTEKNNIELIIMSTHGRSGISRWAMGSVADRVVHSARTPVMTITPPGCRIS